MRGTARQAVVMKIPEPRPGFHTGESQIVALRAAQLMLLVLLPEVGSGGVVPNAAKRPSPRGLLQNLAERRNTGLGLFAGEVHDAQSLAAVLKKDDQMPTRGYTVQHRPCLNPQSIAFFDGFEGCFVAVARHFRHRSFDRLRRAVVALHRLTLVEQIVDLLAVDLDNAHAKRGERLEEPPQNTGQQTCMLCVFVPDDGVRFPGTRLPVCKQAGGNSVVGPRLEAGLPDVVEDFLLSRLLLKHVVELEFADLVRALVQDRNQLVAVARPVQ
mmetsp:Transcript_8029/g.19340  ORF Transcript_8029/g.19340 Transcript_8029/m.19340 type:complete len:270 (-) Transcript_8029:2941-3750(-)